MSEVLIDIEGNQYKTVKIGRQVWMAENLRVSHYKNGESVLVSRDRQQCEWHMNSNESAVYLCEEDTTEYFKYGFLYTPNIIFDERCIAPEGWHVPTLSDWEELVSFLGGVEVAGRKLKSKNGWKKETNQPSTYRFKICEFGGTDDYGFSALPSGKMETHYQDAYDVGMYAWYWAADQQKVSESTTWYGYFNLNYYKGNVSMGCTYVDSYLAIRCIKD